MNVDKIDNNKSLNDFLEESKIDIEELTSLVEDYKYKTKILEELKAFRADGAKETLEEFCVRKHYCLDFDFEHSFALKKHYVEQYEIRAKRQAELKQLIDYKP